jgi:hypothetical protein
MSGNGQDWLVACPLLALFVVGLAAQARSGPDVLTVAAFVGGLAALGIIQPPPSGPTGQGIFLAPHCPGGQNKGRSRGPGEFRSSALANIQRERRRARPTQSPTVQV